MYKEEIEEHVDGIYIDIAKDEQPAEGDGLSIIEAYNEHKPASGDMVLTTSIVTEHIGETNLENKIPYDKPYIITQLPK